MIECSGSEYEIGRQYGEAAARSLRTSLSFMKSSLMHMPYQADINTVLGAARKYLDNVRAFDPGAVDRVRGMADGARISFDEVFALECYTELFVNFPGLTGMCTSFAARGPATKDGGTIIGQNVDWHPDTPLDLVRISRKDGTRMLGLFLAGYGCYYLTSNGMGNCANLTLCPLGPVTMHVPFAFYLYKAMSCSTVGQAMDVLAASARGIGYFHIADGKGKMFGIESVYDDYHIMEPVEGILVHGNHYETEKYRKTDGALVYIQDSFGRTGQLRKRMTEMHGSITPEIMTELLTDHAGLPNSVCRHIDATKPGFESISKASFIMIPAEGRMLISYGPPCENEYVEYSLEG
jgi:isopenicillin-N N-acyltransferase-like protein